MGSKADAGEVGPAVVVVTIVIWVLVVAMFVYGAREMAEIWRDRPIVMWDETEKRWRAVRGYVPKSRR